MRSILSIFLALIITFLLFLAMTTLEILFNIYLNEFPFFAIVFLGGIIATWLSTKNKIRYSIYYGIIFAVIYGFFYSFYSVLFTSLILTPIIAGIGGTIAKNEKNTIKNLLNNKIQGKYKSFFINLYKRNKRVLIASLIIFFASVLIGGVGPYLSSSFNQYMTNLMTNYISLIEHALKLPATYIFINNSRFAFFDMYIYGILFGITSAIELAYTGLVVGFAFVKYPFTPFYLLPHGIFELSSFIIAAAAGFKLSITTLNIIWGGLHIKRDNSIGEQVNKILSANYLKFRDSLTLFIIAIILLVIAAIIEANISLAIGNYITGQNI
jgi:stage II sporulation protein M